MATFGFVGTGNMGGALVKAVAKKVDPKSVFVANRTREKAEQLANEFGCNVTDNYGACECDYVFFGVKPNMINEVIKEVSGALKNRSTSPVVISMAPAVSIEMLAVYTGFSCPIIRIMPNTPVSVGEGVILYAVNENVTPEMEEAFVDSLSLAGTCVKIDEKLMDAGTAISGCGPAFVDLFMESLADGAVSLGIPRQLAIKLAAQTVLGSAKLLLESGKNPGQLKDEVCSPGGSTIAGVRALEEASFRAAGMNAVIAAYEKTLNKMKK